jgi:hypothetical protein
MLRSGVMLCVPSWHSASKGTLQCSIHLGMTCSQSSKQLNEQRLKLLVAKQKLIDDVLEAAKDELKNQAQGPGYGNMIATLLCQVRPSICAP